MPRTMTMTKVERAKLEAIARKHLHLDTLVTRNSDRLDFSDQAVWSLEAALLAAFEAGKSARDTRVNEVLGSRAMN